MDLLKIKVCVFDVNGVLIDSNSANAQAMAQAFTDQPLLQQKIAELYQGLTGIDRGSKIRAETPTQLDEALESIMKRVIGHIPGQPETLEVR